MSDTPIPQTGSTSSAPIRVFIRKMVKRDLPEVLAIERRSFKNPWTKENFIEYDRFPRLAYVAEYKDQVVGFILFETFKTRYHIEKLAVHHCWRRKKVGFQLASDRIGRLSAHRRTSITLEVPETNLFAQLFWQAQGFRAVNVLHNWYEDTPEDAYVMSYRVPSAFRNVVL